MATKLLKLKLYKITIVQRFLSADTAQKLHYCMWFLTSVHDEIVDLNLVFYSDEPWFHLNRYGNSQNSRYWYAENPHVLRQIPLYYVKIGVWCAVKAYVF